MVEPTTDNRETLDRNHVLLPDEEIVCADCRFFFGTSESAWDKGCCTKFNQTPECLCTGFTNMDMYNYFRTLVHESRKKTFIKPVVDRKQ